MLRRLRAEPWDVLVVGGGATGLGVALDAAARGYRTALVEQGDFAEATSSRSTKLIHGGVRYLQQGNIALVRESLRERGRLLRNAPHLVHPLAFVIPHYQRWERPWYGVGLKLYDWLAGDWGVGETRHLTREELLEKMPTLQSRGLRGGLLYHDAQFDDARLAIALARTSVDHEGVVANYVRATRLLKQDGRVAGVEVRDLEDGSEFEIRAKVVVNAAGIFSDEVRHLDEPSTPRLLQHSQGAHVVLPGSFLPGGCALLAPRTDDGRVFFAIPWHGRTLIGTTDTPVTEPRMEPRPQADEIAFLLAHASRYLTAKPTETDILSVFAGVRPLVKAQRDGVVTSALSRSHQVLVSRAGLVSIIGGKWTTYRQMAEDTIDEAAKVGGLRSVSSPTADLKLHGWTSVQVSEGLSISNNSELLHERLPYCVDEVLSAVRHEMARTVADVLSRRLRALLLDARASVEVAPRVAALMAAELGRDASWVRGQVEEFRKLATGYVLGKT